MSPGHIGMANVVELCLGQVLAQHVVNHCCLEDTLILRLLSTGRLPVFDLTLRRAVFTSTSHRDVVSCDRLVLVDLVPDP